MRYGTHAALLRATRETVLSDAPVHPSVRLSASAASAAFVQLAFAARHVIKCYLRINCDDVERTEFEPTVRV